MVRDTYINFQWLLFILVGKICPPMQEHFLGPLLKRKALSAMCHAGPSSLLLFFFLRDVEFSQMVIYRLLDGLKIQICPKPVLIVQIH